MSFCTMISNGNLGWYHDNLFTYRNNWKTDQNHNKFSSQNIVISSQNNTWKCRTKGHEQVLRRHATGNDDCTPLHCVKKCMMNFKSGEAEFTTKRDGIIW